MNAVLQVLLDPIIPVFAVTALGFALGRAGKLAVEDARILNRVLLMVFIPIHLFNLTMKAPIGSFRIEPLLAYLSAEAIMLAVGFLVARLIFRLSAAESFLLAFAAIFVNTVMYVLPLSVLIYGEEAALPIVSVTTMDSTLVFGAAIIAMQAISAQGAQIGDVVRTILLNPILIAIALGFAVNFAGLRPPPTLQTFLDFNGAAMAPLGMFALGVAMARTRFRIDGVVATFCVYKMAVFPLVVLYCLGALAPDAPGAGLYLFASAGPAGAMAFSLALLHNVRTDAIGQVIVITSVLTLFSLAALA